MYCVGYSVWEFSHTGRIGMIIKSLFENVDHYCLKETCLKDPFERHIGHTVGYFCVCDGV